MSAGGEQHSGYCRHDNIKRTCRLCELEDEILLLRTKAAEQKYRIDAACERLVWTIVGTNYESESHAELGEVLDLLRGKTAMPRQKTVTLNERTLPLGSDMLQKALSFQQVNCPSCGEHAEWNRNDSDLGGLEISFYYCQGCDAVIRVTSVPAAISIVPVARVENPFNEDLYDEFDVGAEQVAFCTPEFMQHYIRSWYIAEYNSDGFVGDTVEWELYIQPVDHNTWSPWVKIRKEYA